MLTIKLPPTYKLPAIPAPPLTTSAPVSIDEASVLDITTRLLLEFVPILLLAYNWNAPKFACVLALPKNNVPTLACVETLPKNSVPTLACVAMLESYNNPTLACVAMLELYNNPMFACVLALPKKMVPMFAWVATLPRNSVPTLALRSPTLASSVLS